MKHLRRHFWIFLALACLPACQSTVPTAADMDRYHREAELQAQRQISMLDAQVARKEITPQRRDELARAIEADIPRQAGEMAWAKHELFESQQRAHGIPTGDAPIRLDAPTQGMADSFYRPYGEAGSGFGNSQGLNNPSGLWRGSTPGTMANTAAERSIGTY